MVSRRLAPLMFTILALPLLAGAATEQAPMERRERVSTAMRGAEDKLSPALRRLYQQFTASRGSDDHYPLAESNFLRLYGVRRDDPHPVVQVIARVDPHQSLQALQTAGARIVFRAGDLICASIPVRRLESLTRLVVVRSVDAVPAGSIPQPPEARETPQVLAAAVSRGARSMRLANEFNHSGLTGRGVVVAVVDTGIDWRHRDFIRPNGTSRILALWDTTDPSWAHSGGKIGSKPPFTEPGTGRPLGTLYTQQQVTAALAGRATVHSQDRFGHGTACAGTAAGNGRATANGVRAGAYAGVAPEADLVVVNASDPERGSGISDTWLMGTYWAIQYSRSLRKPCVVNQSFGGNYTAKDGTHPSEQILDRVCGPGKPGVVICTAAGNDGRYSFHAGGRFGPKRSGQQDIGSQEIDLGITEQTVLTSYFRHSDDWGLAISGQDKFLVDNQGGPMQARLFRSGGHLMGELWLRRDATPRLPSDFRQYFQQAVGMKQINNRTDVLELVLPPGRYILNGFGASVKVNNGRFDLILPNPRSGSFGQGTQREVMVSSPGTARYPLTAGAYDFRGSWVNQQGRQVRYNLQPGECADYSSPGYRRDGFVKPDLLAPATYTVSALASHCEMARLMGENHVTRDGHHIAWAGTSAATPYVAGVVALMLQKNPGLDAAQVKAILTRTVYKPDRFSGSLPNPRWGYGKINPQAALRATPGARTSRHAARLPHSRAAGGR